MGNGEKSDPHSSKNELHVVSANVSVQPLFDLCRDGDIGRGRRDVSITMSVPKKRGFWPALMHALHSHDIDVTSATLCTNHHTDFHSINCKLDEESGLQTEDIQRFLEDLCVSEFNIRPYKL